MTQQTDDLTVLHVADDTPEPQDGETMWVTTVAHVRDTIPLEVPAANAELARTIARQEAARRFGWKPAEIVVMEPRRQ